MATYYAAATGSTNTTQVYSAWITNGVWSNWTIGASTIAPIVTGTTAWNTWTTDRVWGTWIAGTTGSSTTTTLGAPVFLRDERTPEQRAADEERWRQRRAADEVRLAKERADHEQAVARAETLLHENLTVRQRRSLHQRQSFRVRARSGRCYEIVRGHHANVYELNAQNKRAQQLCVYPRGGLPDADCMLAQKFWLETNEDGIRKVANLTPVYG